MCWGVNVFGVVKNIFERLPSTLTRAHGDVRWESQKIKLKYYTQTPHKTHVCNSFPANFVQCRQLLTDNEKDPEKQRLKKHRQGFSH